MRKLVTSVLAVVSIAVVLGVAVAGLPETTTVQSGATITEVHNGQTFEMTASGIAVEVTFLNVTPSNADGLVSKISGQSGTFTILWVDTNISQSIQLTPGQPDQLFGLEGGDGDKKGSSGGEIN